MRYYDVMSRNNIIQYFKAKMKEKMFNDLMNGQSALRSLINDFNTLYSKLCREELFTINDAINSIEGTVHEKVDWDRFYHAVSKKSPTSISGGMNCGLHGVLLTFASYNIII